MKKSQFLWGAILLLVAGAGAPARAGDAPPAATSEPAASTAAATAEPAAGEPDRVGVFGVFERYPFQAYAGYTFVNFHEVPGTTGYMNGFNISMVYYPMSQRFGGDGEMLAVFGTLRPFNSHLVTALGGLRCRFGVTRRAEWWIHGLAGESNLLPQTPYGKQSAFTYEAGGGLDLTPGKGHLAYRVQIDALGSRFFGTYQINPKVSAGIVLKF